MKLTILTAHLSRAAGGLYVSVPGLIKGLNAISACSVDVAGIRDPFYPNDWISWGPKVHPVAQSGPRRFGYAPALEGSLRALSPDIVDVQGLWMYHSLANLRHARRTRTPYIITPRGMLDPWALRQGSIRKLFVRQWFEDAHLGGASCIRALSLAEARAIRETGLTNPIALVPNGVSLPDLLPPTMSRNSPRTLLFLGRLDAKKGVTQLIQAWSQVQDLARRYGWRLQITGWAATERRRELERLVRQLALASDIIEITGPRFGSAKAATFTSATAFVLPSFGEGLPMAVLEAWSYGLPTILTDGCNLPEGFEIGAALRTEPNQNAISKTLTALFQAPDHALTDMGNRGRSLVQKRFTWPFVASEMLRVYAWALNGGEVPSCILPPGRCPPSA